MEDGGAASRRHGEAPGGDYQGSYQGSVKSGAPEGAVMQQTVWESSGEKKKKPRTVEDQSQAVIMVMNSSRDTPAWIELHEMRRWHSPVIIF